MIKITATAAWYPGGPKAPKLVATPEELAVRNQKLFEFFEFLGGYPEPYDDAGETKVNVNRWIIPTVDENMDLHLWKYGGRWHWTLVSLTSNALPQGSGRRLTIWLDISSQRYHLRVVAKGAGATFQLRKKRA